ncbi:response regulator [Wenzhouxiangella limi]|uniref:Response regulator n=1 Tax=Wenzhouxiangella limi TaxID=2707351 RepID=A0A845US27_9GAMM|nr:response regulator [Wenzhouxiangella limi]NDY94643.1 response regulator [Wenzhouxiangella limi]
MIKLMIVEDHELFRTGINNILAKFDNIEVVAETSNGEDAIRLARQLEPDVILMDVGLPGLSGLETTERILKTQSDIRVIVLTAHAEPPLPARLLDIGASGYLTKGASADELVSAVQAVHRGERYIGSEIAQQLALSLLPGTPASPFQDLTGRELEVTLMLIQGMKANSIGEVLKLSPKTVATHKYRIYDKVGVRNEVELLRLAIRYGLFKPEV